MVDSFILAGTQDFIIGVSNAKFPQKFYDVIGISYNFFHVLHLSLLIYEPCFTSFRNCKHTCIFVRCLDVLVIWSYNFALGQVIQLTS